MIKPAKRSLPPSLEVLLVEEKLLDPAQMEQARRVMDDNGVGLGTAVMFLDLVPVAKLADALRVRAGIRHVPLGQLQLPAGAKNLLAPEVARASEAFPLGLIDDSGQKIALVGMTDPLDSTAVTRVQLAMGVPVQTAFLSLADLQSLYKRYYRSGLPLFPPESTSAGERTVSRRLDPLLSSSTKGEKRPISTEVRALVKLLEAKGLLSEREFQAFLEKERG